MIRVDIPPLRIPQNRAGDRLLNIEDTEDLQRSLPLGENDASDSAGGVSGSNVNVVSSIGTIRSVPLSASDTNPGTFPTALKVVNGATSILLDSTGITMNTGSNTFTITFAALTQNVALRTDGYCDSGVAKSQMHVGSPPF